MPKPGASKNLRPSHEGRLDKRFPRRPKRWRLLIANVLHSGTRSVRSQTSPSPASSWPRPLHLQPHVGDAPAHEWNKLDRAYSTSTRFGSFDGKKFAEHLRESLFQEIKFKFNTELFQQPLLLCDELQIDNEALATVLGHETASRRNRRAGGIPLGQAELFPFRHLYL